MILLFGLAALAVDIGVFVPSRKHGVQTVADAAALGGARDGLSTSTATAIATEMGYTNGVAGATVNVTTPAAQQLR